MSKVAVIAGSVAQRPGKGGHTWVFLQYLLGLRRLGWNVLFLDRLDADMGVEFETGQRYLANVMDRFGLNYALFCDDGKRVVGKSWREVLEIVGDSGLFLNAMGFFEDEEILSRARRRVFLDIDPGFGQMWQELKLHALFKGHHQYVTIGENIGRADCAIPICGIDWITTRQPVVVGEWPVTARGERVTSVVSWRGPFGPVEFGGKIYGLRAHEFRKFVELPKNSAMEFELALDIHPAETKDLALLQENGWKSVRPEDVASDPWRYRQYVQQSAAELMIAKGMYVDTRSGWVSDRSICYLASGKPVMAQDTGLNGLYPVGEGMITFIDLDGALRAAREINENYEKHSHAARRMAEEYFDSDRVLTTLLKKLGVEQ
jgi:hypothetical protein